MVPQQPGGWANLGVMLKVEGRFDAALKAYDQAIALAPDDARIRVNRTVALLHAGRLREAWRDFEWRLALPEHRIVDLDGAMPLLPNLDHVAGRTILVTHSDGFGDTLQFMRYVPLLAARGARVLLRIPQPLSGASWAAWQRRLATMNRCRHSISIARSSACRASSTLRWRRSRTRMPYLSRRSRVWFPNGLRAFRPAACVSDWSGRGRPVRI